MGGGVLRRARGTAAQADEDAGVAASRSIPGYCILSSRMGTPNPGQGARLLS